MSLKPNYGSIPGDEGAAPLMIHQRRRSSGGSITDMIVNQLVHEGDDDYSIRSVGGHATILSEVFNISKNLVGCGVLSLSSGMAMYSNSPQAIISSAFWIALMGAIFGYYCVLIAKICKMTASATYRECWEDSVGERGALAVSLVNAIKPALANLAYCAILSQTFQSLLATVGFHISRIGSLLLITIFCLLPLCLLKNLNVLAPFSALGTLGILMTAVAMMVRYLDGSYQPGGVYFNDIPVNMQPVFGNENSPFSMQAAPFLCMVFEAWVMHYNSPRFYTELAEATIPRFTYAVIFSFGLSAALYIAIAAFGFLTFGENSNGFIMNNYSDKDPLATFCRLAIAVSTLLTFPIVFIGFRDGIVGVLDIPSEKQTNTSLNILTVILLTFLTIVAIFWTDLGLINAVGGGTLATAIVFVFPAFMYRGAVQALNELSTRGQWREVVLAFVLMTFGVYLGLLGVFQIL